jgi:hypothetical protein
VISYAVMPSGRAPIASRRAASDLSWIAADSSRDVVEPVVVHELLDAADADPVRPDDRVQVAEHHLRHAAVGGDELLDDRHHRAAGVELVRHEARALDEHVGRLEVAEVATDVGHMGHGSEEGDEAALVEDRRDEVVVG